MNDFGETSSARPSRSACQCFRNCDSMKHNFVRLFYVFLTIRETVSLELRWR